MLLGARQPSLVSRPVVVLLNAKSTEAKKCERRSQIRIATVKNKFERVDDNATFTDNHRPNQQLMARRSLSPYQIA